MSFVREPILQSTPILDLRPTQMTVGMREVTEKRKTWRAHDPKTRAKFLRAHMIPVILGPGSKPFVIDHHHLARALHDEGEKAVFITVVKDLHKLDDNAFWTVLDFEALTHPYDARGKRRDFADLPKSVRGLEDDPFRSLAGELRRVGGYAKDTTPFSEFLWADFLRRRIKAKTVDKNFSATLEKALQLAKSPDADYLPGWCGPHVP
ncbi:MAG TPA: ParB-like protein [Roseiarcus sp.]|nr:ParB-like protein [Roseiarcus sp.]